MSRCIHFISVCKDEFSGRSKVRCRSLHGIVELPVLQGLPLILWFILQVIPFFQVAQHQAMKDMVVGLVDELLK